MNPLALSSQLLQSFSGKTIVVTGSSGFLGSALLNSLAQVHCTIRAMTRDPSHVQALQGPAKLEIIKWAAQESTSWENNLKNCDILFHFAAQTSMRTALQQPDFDAALNLHPVLEMIKAARLSTQPISVVFASTASIFGCPEKLPVDETFPDHPLTPYCLHKQLAEGYLKQAAKEGVLQALSLRLPNIYGPGREASSKDRSILNRLIKQALQGELLSVYGEGIEKRDYLFITDTVDAFLRAALHTRQAAGNAYVIGSGKSQTIRDSVLVLQRIALELTGKTSAIKTVEAPDPLPIESRNYEADFSRFQTLTGWQPFTDFESGIRITAKHFLDSSPS